jgi:hypothetical protein
VERGPSGLRQQFAKLRGLIASSWVRIPSSPPVV